MQIPFSPPQISEDAIESVVETLRNGWITTGPKAKQFEENLTEYMGTEGTVCMNSATAALEMTLRLLGIGPGDEVITSAYTYTASASVIHHVGAEIVLVDTQKDSLEMDYNQLEDKITKNTKAIIPIDIAGQLCDYEKIFEIAERKQNLFSTQNKIHQILNRIAVIDDGAHSFGAQKNGVPSGRFADFTTFSFHAVKNLTTAEGGAVTWTKDYSQYGIDIAKIFEVAILHGQSKDALCKMQKGNWEYDIQELGYKFNMTDINAAIGIDQLDKYDDNLKRRKEIVEYYEAHLNPEYLETLKHFDNEKESSCHLFLTWIKGITEEQRNNIITRLAEEGIATNVHYKPLPLFTAYKNYGFDIKDFPNAFAHYQNELTLPLYPQMTDEEVGYVVKKVNQAVSEVLI
ncbi:aminotransferase class-V family protein [Staphylococcus piscifermentans]|uniref:Capsular polysaccharide biosynthesis protein n=1 Tax=Staphylococcus piscifermentans TaxID=70258 RepID=A0A239TJJ5_9STAP|nr:DegT/DnrJ/EryC1/StrS family aminotransferase [Staphylococcus piscifermentans]RTX86752.1 DegT/DnrJ/EryC1/StrS family aminotransferase [Staphylococcus piscifermentans]GEP84508.1 capsular polysaccharide biosynthesis protein [Staphylococcus piscifermentans]SNU97765.1 aminotransferase class-V family protein [Staphylococcus piscifermentans]